MICMFWIAHLFSKYSSRIYILWITFYGMFDFQLKFKPDIKENILKSRAYDLFFLGVFSQCLYVTSLIASAFFRIIFLLNIYIYRNVTAVNSMEFNELFARVHHVGCVIGETKKRSIVSNHYETHSLRAALWHDVPGLVGWPVVWKTSVILKWKQKPPASIILSKQLLLVHRS